MKLFVSIIGLSVFMISSSSQACTVFSNTSDALGEVRGTQVISYGRGLIGSINGSQVLNSWGYLVGYISGRDVIKTSMVGKRKVARIENSQVITVPSGERAVSGVGCANIELGAAYILFFHPHSKIIR